MAKRRVGHYPRAFRQMAVDRLRKCDNVVAVSEELGVHRRLLGPRLATEIRAYDAASIVSVVAYS